jgi:DNA-binding winged helix-turn-helix (wHTH) protein
MLRPDNHLYEFGPFVLDARSRILLRDGATVRLTPKAFETLLVLVQARVQVVDKEQLTEGGVAGHLCRRGKSFAQHTRIEEGAGRRYFAAVLHRNIPKRGYRFLAPLKVSLAEVQAIRVGGETTVIEKHTFARVLTEEFEGPDLPMKLERFLRRYLPQLATSPRTRKVVLVAAAVLQYCSLVPLASYSI